jgi:spermidine synthase
MALRGGGQPRLAGLLPIFAASGASGLVYELVWVRQFGILFGSSVYSAALVTAIYMCGLGLGAWLVADLADRRFRADPVAPLRWYAGFELAIAAFAAFAALLMPSLARWSAEAASYQPGAHGWFWLAPIGSLARYGAAAVLLLPITLMMGGTLTLLIRFAVASDVTNAGWRVGLLYGTNTAGAALGCLLTDTALVPLFGLGATQSLAVAGNLFAAAAARVLAARSDAGSRAPARVEEPASDVRLAWLALALALTGFASMAMQIVWFRQLIAMLGSFRPVFSLLLTVILVGIWLGSMCAGRFVRRVSAQGLYALTLAGFAVTAAGGVGLLHHSAGTFDVLGSGGTASGGHWHVFYARLLREIAWVVGPPAFFAGAAYPLANAIAQRHSDRVGGRAGVLYLANTLGGVLGSLLAGFALLPRLGIQATVTAIVLAALAALFGSWRAASERTLERSGRWLHAASCGAILLALAVWTRLPSDFLVRRSLPLAPGATGGGLLAVHEGVNETLAILWEPGPSLTLLTNGHRMSGTNFDAQRYMRAFVHVPMLIDPDIEQVLVMCFGVGTTARAALFYPQVRHVDVVDLSPDVLEHARYAESVNGRPLEDPRVSVFVNDARHHLLMSRAESYDLITGEPPPITHAGVNNLYTEEFFALARSRLRRGGYVTYWLPLWQVGESAARAVIRGFLDVFPGAVLLSGYGPELILVGRKDAAIEIDPRQVRQRLNELPALREDLRGIELASISDLVGMLVAAAPGLARATSGASPLRDDRPLLEYAVRELQGDPQIPGDLASPADLDLWCPDCFHGALDAEEQARLRGTLEVMGLYFRSEAFLSARPVAPRAGGEALSAEAERAIADDLYLQSLLYELPPLHQRALQLARHGRTRGAIASLEELLRADPGNARARADLAHLRGENAGPDPSPTPLP